MTYINFSQSAPFEQGGRHTYFAPVTAGISRTLALKALRAFIFLLLLQNSKSHANQQRETVPMPVTVWRVNGGEYQQSGTGFGSLASGPLYHN